MNKKAITIPAKFVATVIVILIFAILLILMINKFFDNAEVSTIERKCSISVNQEAGISEAASSINAGHTARDFATNIDCQTIPIEITEKDERKVSGLTRSFMDSCWKTFGSGKREIFSRVESGKNTFCNICYSLTYASGQTFDLKNSLEKLPASFENNYDVPDEITGDALAVVYYYKVTDLGAEQKVVVRPFNDLGICSTAEFPPQRLT